MTVRLTSSSLAGTLWKLVAVGTARLASMLATMRAAAPRMRLRGSPSAAARLGRTGPAAGGRRRLRRAWRGRRGSAAGCRPPAPVAPWAAAVAAGRAGWR